MKYRGWEKEREREVKHVFRKSLREKVRERFSRLLHGIQIMAVVIRNPAMMMRLYNFWNLVLFLSISSACWENCKLLRTWYGFSRVDKSFLGIITTKTLEKWNMTKVLICHTTVGDRFIKREIGWCSASKSDRGWETIWHSMSNGKLSNTMLLCSWCLIFAPNILTSLLWELKIRHENRVPLLGVEISFWNHLLVT